MPIYEYRCTACGRRFTEFSRKVLAREEDVQPPCPNCLSSETKRLVGSFIMQGPKPAHPSEAGFNNEQHEREMQMTPQEHIEEYRKMTNPDPE
jgi:putative FmdB family regulatory protein